MKITVGELMEKIGDIDHTIKELHKLPQDICEVAEDYLNEYIVMLQDIKVDV